MIRDGWNFHGDIALMLETTARNYYQVDPNVSNKIYSADLIEGGCFVEVMICMLREKSCFQNSILEIDDFVKECNPYLGVGGHSINPEVAQALYDRFEKIFSNL